jgi:hypothetical protein
MMLQAALLLEGIMILSLSKLFTQLKDPRSLMKLILKVRSMFRCNMRQSSEQHPSSIPQQALVTTSKFTELVLHAGCGPGPGGPAGCGGQAGGS